MLDNNNAQHIANLLRDHAANPANSNSQTTPPSQGEQSQKPRCAPHASSAHGVPLVVVYGHVAVTVNHHTHHHVAAL